MPPMEERKGYPRPRHITPKIHELVGHFEENPVTAPSSTSSLPPIEIDDQGQVVTRINFDKEYPRIAMTPSMLYTYASMRGRSSLQGDPVHSALYPVPKRWLGAGRVIIPMVKERGSMDELFRGATFFWDPMVTTPPGPQPPTPAVIPGPTMKSKKAKPLTYLEHKATYPPSVGRNHYKGEMVYANFGYVQDADTKAWIDPDSAGLLRDEYIQRIYIDGTEEKEERVLPDFQRSEKSGPRKITMEQQDEFYREYIEYVHDDVDAEGDPRNYRISPATFARWAAGAQSGDHYHEETYTTENTAWSKRAPSVLQEKDRRPKGNWICFDQETGSVMSEYEVEKEPAVLTYSEGVDMSRIPTGFTRCLPAVARDLTRQAFGNSQHAHGAITPPSTDSVPTVFNEDKAIESLGVPGDPDSGLAEFLEKEAILLEKREEAEQLDDNTLSKDKQERHSRAQEIKLAREVAFLKARRDAEHKVNVRSYNYGLDGAASLSPPRNSTTPHREGLYDEGIDPFPFLCTHLDEPVSSPATLQQPAKLKGKQYRKYFAEQIEAENIKIATKRHLDDMIETELQETAKGIRELRAEKEDLLRDFGCKQMEDIPFFHIPKPEHHRVNFD
ncbi:hypothetical protein EG329_000520 [Mollisiaceae sp. DMI_Dod_QoI]|nr:hypothetical protein EG329_000520 [Helotiales sp. DMI_Dod_QoI]